MGKFHDNQWLGFLNLLSIKTTERKYIKRVKISKTNRRNPNCPSPVCRTIAIEAFRFVFEDINHRNNFLPVLLINPKRQLTEDSEKCSGYALSFFCSIGKSKTQYI